MGKYFKTMNGTNKDLIKTMKRKQMRDTNGHDIDFSTSSMDTRNTYNNEYSISASDRTDITETQESNSALPIQSKYNMSPLHKPLTVAPNTNTNSGNDGLEKISESKEAHYMNMNNNHSDRVDNKWNRRSTHHLKGPEAVDPRF